MIENLCVVCVLCDCYGICVFFDVTCVIENVWLVKECEFGWVDVLLFEILFVMCVCVDGCMMIGKKDLLVNIGGFFVLNDDDFFEEVCNFVVFYEGLYIYGGFVGCDMEVMVVGIDEVLCEEYMVVCIG